LDEVTITLNKGTLLSSRPFFLVFFFSDFFLSSFALLLRFQ
jgi:hypothetical protein